MGAAYSNLGRTKVLYATSLVLLGAKAKFLRRKPKVLVQGGQSRDTHVVISHVLFSFFARFKVCFTIIFLFFGGFHKCHLVQSTQTRKLFLMALKF